MKLHGLFALCVGAGLLLGCERAQETTAPTPPAEAVAEVSIAGVYKVKGTTVEKKSGNEREISGTVTLAQEGDRYTASFELKTKYPTPDGPADADVLGTGQGELEGRTLRGIAETQLVMATVPGVDTAFAYVPRIVGPRLVSKTAGELGKDGTLSIEIDNEPAEGEVYDPTHTTLRGMRISR